MARQPTQSTQPTPPVPAHATPLADVKHESWSNSVLSEEEQTEAKKRARVRAIRQFDRREHLRAEIQTREHLRTIQALLTNPWPDDRDRMYEMAKKLDGHFKMLDRVLPALKPMEGNPWAARAFSSDEEDAHQAINTQVNIIALPVVNPHTNQTSPPKILRTIDMAKNEAIDAAPTSADTAPTNTDKEELPPWLS